MKRNYVKPEICFESFELAESIASGCTHLAGSTQGLCSVIIAGENVFLSNVMACSGSDVEDGADGLCYYLPFETNNIFSS